MVAKAVDMRLRRLKKCPFYRAALTSGTGPSIRNTHFDRLFRGRGTHPLASFSAVSMRVQPSTDFKRGVLISYKKTIVT